MINGGFFVGKTKETSTTHSFGWENLPGAPGAALGSPGGNALAMDAMAAETLRLEAHAVRDSAG